MNTPALFVPLAIAAISPPRAAQTPPAVTPGVLSAAQIVANVDAFYARTSDFTAQFTQVSRARLTGTERRSSGTLQFARPGRFRWSYRSPAGDLIVSDGATAWAYEASSRQAFSCAAGGSPTLASLPFLGGPGTLASAFFARERSGLQWRYPAGHVIELRPARATATVERILLYVDGQSYQVTRAVVINAQGDTNRYDFTSPQANTGVPASAFRWSPPAGTTVVASGSACP